MKKANPYYIFAVVSLAFLLLSQTFQKSLILADYVLNSSSFAAQCINTNKPELHCNGKCQLSKKLNDVDKNQPLLVNVKVIDVNLFCKEPFHFEVLKFSQERNNFFEQNYFKNNFFQRLFLKPPIS